MSLNLLPIIKITFLIIFCLFSFVQAQFYHVQDGYQTNHGIIDSKGKIVKPLVYSNIIDGLIPGSWILYKTDGDKVSTEYIDKNLKTILKVDAELEKIGNFLTLKSGESCIYYDKWGKKRATNISGLNFSNNWAFKNKKLYHVSGKIIETTNIDYVNFLDSTRFLCNYYEDKNKSSNEIRLMSIDMKIIRRWLGSSTFCISEAKKCFFVKDIDGSYSKYDLGGVLQKANIHSVDCPRYMGEYLVSHTSGTMILDEKGKVYFNNDHVFISEINKLKFAIASEGENQYFLDPTFNKIGISYKSTFFFNDSLGIAIDFDYNYWLINLKTKKQKSLPFKNDGSGYEPTSKTGIFHIYNSVEGTGFDGNPNTEEELIKAYGGTRSVYINSAGKVIWESKPYYVCFPAGSQVSTSQNNVSIENLKKGDKVWALKNNKIIQTEVSNLEIHKGSFDLLELNILVTNSLAHLSNFPIENIVLKLTPNHPILTDKGYTPASKLTNQKILIK